MESWCASRIKPRCRDPPIDHLGGLDANPLVGQRAAALNELPFVSALTDVRSAAHDSPVQTAGSLQRLDHPTVANTRATIRGGCLLRGVRPPFRDPLLLQPGARYQARPAQGTLTARLRGGATIPFRGSPPQGTRALLLVYSYNRLLWLEHRTIKFQGPNIS